MQNGVYRVGIVGLSGISMGAPDVSPSPPPFRNQIIVSHLASLAHVQRTEVVGVCDRIPELLDKFKDTWGSRWPDARTYTDHQEMLDKENLDILAVATGDNVHTEITVDGANAGVKAVFCEKPLATSLEDADRMIQACADNGVVLAVDHTRRWRPIYHKVRDTIRAGTIGPLSTIVATIGGPRAMAFRNGTHMLDTVCFFAESEPAQVFASLEAGFEDWDVYRGDGGRLPKNEPGLTGFIYFRNGVRTLYNGTKGTFQMFSLQLSGPEGQIHITDAGAQLMTAGSGVANVQKRDLRPDDYQVHGLVAAYEEIIGAIDSRGQVDSSGKEARKTVQILIGFLKSAQNGSRLVDVPA
jgi:predicted dehydrogenase